MTTNFTSSASTSQLSCQHSRERLIAQTILVRCSYNNDDNSFCDYIADKLTPVSLSCHIMPCSPFHLTRDTLLNTLFAGLYALRFKYIGRQVSKACQHCFSRGWQSSPTATLGYYRKHRRLR